MANYQVLSLDTATPQIKAPGTGNGYSFDSGATNLGTWTTSALNLSTPLTLTTALASSSGGTGLTGFTANGVVYASSSSALTTGSALTFDGTYFTASGLRIAGADTANTIYQPTGGLALSTGSASGITFATNLTTRYSIDSTGVSVWSVGGSEQMRLNSTGLGIGTSSPSYKLDVSGSIRATTGVTGTRVDPRVSSTASTAAITPDVSSYDQYCVTAQAVNLAINAPIGSPVDGNKLMFRILDNGTSRTLTWNATFTAIGVTIPTATTINKTTYVGCIYNAAASRWDVISVTTQA